MIRDSIVYEIGNKFAKLIRQIYRFPVAVGIQYLGQNGIILVVYNPIPNVPPYQFMQYDSVEGAYNDLAGRLV